MLTKLLRRIAQAGGAVATGELARALGVSDGLVEQMIEQLGRLGYLDPVSPVCAGGCGHCPQRSACAIPSQARLWSLTERGRRMVREAEPEGATERGLA